MQYGRITENLFTKQMRKKNKKKKMEKRLNKQFFK